MRRLAALLVTAGLLAGCGDDEADTGTNALPDENTPTVAKPAERVTVRETEFALDPARVDGGSKGLVRIEVVNRGDIAHSLAVEGPNGLVEMDGSLEPGAKGTLEVDLDKPGTYKMFCPLGNHAAKGMTGTISVGGEAPARGGEGDTETLTETTPTQTQTQTQTQTRTTTQTQTVTTPSESEDRTGTDTGPTATTGTSADR